VDAVIYLRQSQDRSGDQYGVSRQRDDARILARLREWTVVEEFVDNDVSASGKRVRPGFEGVIKALHERRASAVIAWDMSRMSRNARDTLRLLEAGQAGEATLAFVRGSDLNLATADGRTMAGILSSIAQGEIDKKSERQKRAAEQAAIAGRRTAGRRAFGYGVQVGEDKVTGKLIIDYDQIVDAEADALRKAYRDRLAGAKLGTIAKEWNALGLRPSQGTRDGRPSVWTAQNLGPVLLNPRYAGLRVHTTDAVRDTMHPVKARLASIVGKATWPPIIDEPTWRAVVGLMTAPERRVSGRSGQRFLTGVALCGVCGATVHGSRNKLQQPSYRCSADYGHFGRRLEPVDAYVNEVVVMFLSRPDLAAVLREGEPDDLDLLRAEMSAVRARLDEQAALHAAGEIDTAQLRAGSALLRRKLEVLEKQMAAAGRDSVLTSLADSADPARTWAGLDVDRRRAIVQRLFQVVLLPPGRGTHVFRPESVQISPLGSE
jgi:site-specific DNA recombinase